MKFKILIFETIIIFLISIFLGIVLSFITNDVKKGNRLKVFKLCIKFLIIYPIILPIIALKQKKLLAYKMVEKKYDRKKYDRKKLNKRARKVQSSLTFIKTLHIAIKLQKYIITNYPNYIKKNLCLANRLVEKKVYQKEVTEEPLQYRKVNLIFNIIRFASCRFKNIDNIFLNELNITIDR